MLADGSSPRGSTPLAVSGAAGTLASTAGATVSGAPGVLPLGMKVGWAFGAAGQTTMLYVVNLILMYFMVTQLGMGAALAGSLLLAARVYDVFLDVLVGLTSDRLNTRFGRRRPWMTAGAALSFVAGLMLFVPFFAAGTMPRLVQFGIGLVLYYSGYSLYSVTSTAMAAEMTESPDERTSIMSYRTFFVLVAGLFSGAALPGLIGVLGGNAFAYIVAGLVAAVFVVISMMTSVVATRNARAVRSVASQLPIWQYLGSVAGNRPFLLLLGVKFLTYIGTSATGAASLFFIRQALSRDERWMGLLQLCSNLAGLAALPAWRYCAGRTSKATTYAAALVVGALAHFSWLFATPHEANAVFVIRSLITGISSGGTVLMTLSVLPDTMDYDFRKSGLRREGIYAGVFEFFTKTAFAVGPFLVGLYLSANGFVPGSAGHTSQPPSAVAAVRVTMAVIPAVAYAAALLLILVNRRVWSLPPVVRQSA